MNNKMKSKEICACPVVYALNIIGGKWHLPIIWALSQSKVLRYNELKRNVCGITNMMLSQSLKELESNGLIVRVQYIEIPPRVEYALTEAGINLLPALDELAKWGVKQMTTASKMNSCSKNEDLPET